jgi:TonB family protein
MTRLIIYSDKRMKMSPFKRFIYAVTVSAAVHVLFFIALLGGEGGRKGPLRVPGMLFVELINLGARGVEARMADEAAMFPLQTDEERKDNELEPPPALDLERTDGDDPVRDGGESLPGRPSSERRGFKADDPAGAPPRAPRVHPGEDLPAVERRGSGARAGRPDNPNWPHPLCAVCPPPVYPPLAQERGIEGVVSLRVEVLAGGRVGDIFVTSSSGFPILDEAALARVKTWTFYQTDEDGEPAPAIRQVTIPFKLPAP